MGNMFELSTFPSIVPFSILCINFATILKFYADVYIEERHYSSHVACQVESVRALTNIYDNCFCPFRVKIRLLLKLKSFSKQKGYKEILICHAFKTEQKTTGEEKCPSFERVPQNKFIKTDQSILKLDIFFFKSNPIFVDHNSID